MAGLVPAIGVFKLSSETTKTCMPQQVPRHGEREAVLEEFFIGGVAACLAAWAALALAQAYPSRPVEIVVPFAAGGGTDALTRFVAAGWSSGSVNR